MPTVALDALHDITRRISGTPVFTQVADKLHAAAAEVQAAAAELRGLGQHVVDSARQVIMGKKTPLCISTVSLTQHRVLSSVLCAVPVSARRRLCSDRWRRWRRRAPH